MNDDKKPPRRMMGTAPAPLGYHSKEHDESASCASEPACQPVPESPALQEPPVTQDDESVTKLDYVTAQMSEERAAYIADALRYYALKEQHEAEVVRLRLVAKTHAEGNSIATEAMLATRDERDALRAQVERLTADVRLWREDSEFHRGVGKHSACETLGHGPLRAEKPR